MSRPVPAALLLAAAIASCDAPAAPPPPSIVLVVLDTLRLDRLSTYGYGRPTTPALDELARSGVVFDGAYAAASYTWPSTASLMTGLHPQEHGVLDKEACYLADELETLAETLQRAGYRTAAWSGNPLVTPLHNFGQGFDEFDRAPTFRKTGELIDSLTEWIGSQGDAPFFAYVHLVDTHWPYQPLQEGARRFAEGAPEEVDALPFVEAKKLLRRGRGHTSTGERVTEQVVAADEQRLFSDLYDACVWTADHYLGVLLDGLESAGLRERTVVAVTSDHGEELFDRGLLGHGHSLFPEVIRAPLVLAGPGIPAGRRIGVPVSNRHLAPTLARLAGTSFSGSPDPLDLLALAGGGSGAEPVLFSTFHGFWNGKSGLDLIGLRAGDRLIQVAPGGAPWGETGRPDAWDVRLFDLAADPREEHDLAQREPETVARLTALLRERLARFERRERRPAAGPSADAETIELLQRIGYIGEEE